MIGIVAALAVVAAMIVNRNERLQNQMMNSPLENKNTNTTEPALYQRFKYYDIDL